MQSVSSIQQAAASTAKPAGSALRVLVVDDLVDAAESLARLLRYDQHEVRTTYHGEAALEAACDFHPDVVLLDIGLPGLDGFAVAHKLRSLPGCRSALIVAITGHAQPADRDEALQAGIDCYLLKPIRIEQLQAVLAERLPH